MPRPRRSTRRRAHNGEGPRATDSPDRVGLQQFIDQAPLSGRQRLIFFLTFLVLLADGMDLAIVGLVFPRIIAEWETSIGQVTITVTAGVLAMAVGAIVSGLIADTAQSGFVMAMWGWGSLAGQVGVSVVLKRFDRFLTGVGAAAWTIVGLVVVVVGDLGFVGLMLVLLITAIGAAALPTTTNVIGTIAYPDQARATGVGASSFMGRIGSVVSGLAGGLLIAAGFTLPSMFAVLTVPVVIVGAAFVGLRAETRRRMRVSAQV